jgi:hypothetical protein
MVLLRCCRLPLTARSLSEWVAWPQPETDAAAAEYCLGDWLTGFVGQPAEFALVEKDDDPLGTFSWCSGAADEQFAGARYDERYGLPVGVFGHSSTRRERRATDRLDASSKNAHVSSSHSRGLDSRHGSWS